MGPQVFRERMEHPNYPLARLWPRFLSPNPFPAGNVIWMLSGVMSGRAYDVMPARSEFLLVRTAERTDPFFGEICQIVVTPVKKCGCGWKRAFDPFHSTCR